MRLNEQFLDQVYEDYFIYLDQLDKDRAPMSYESFEWMKVREIEEDRTEVAVCDP